MKIGLRDIRHLAVIGAAGAAGVVATLAVVRAAEGPRAPYEGIRVEPVQYERIRVEPVQLRYVPVRRSDRTVRIQVRGRSDASPVVYIDGVRVDRAAEERTGLDDLAPGDIAEVDVLKGDKAVERYGAEAENGVILVTTKAGKEMAGKKKAGKKKAGEGNEGGR